jgi:hypothetical protein
MLYRDVDVSNMIYRSVANKRNLMWPEKFSKIEAGHTLKLFYFFSAYHEIEKNYTTVIESLFDK